MRPMGRNTLGWLQMLCGTLGVFCVALAIVLAHHGPAATQRSVYLWAAVLTAGFLLLLVLALRLLRRFGHRIATQNNGQRETRAARSSSSASAFDANER
jgi:cytochrome b561